MEAEDSHVGLVSLLYIMTAMVGGSVWWVVVGGGGVVAFEGTYTYVVPTFTFYRIQSSGQHQQIKSNNHGGYL